MESQPLTPARATLQLALLNAEAISVDSSDIFAWLRDADLPSEAAMRLSGLVDATREIGGKVISIGRIVLLKIIEFVKAHPNLATGIAVGAAIGALVSLVPFLGTYLAPVATALGVAVGAIAGHRLDKRAQGRAVENDSKVVHLVEDVIEIARAFFKLFAQILSLILTGSVSIGS